MTASTDTPAEATESFETAVRLLRKASRVMALSGAGISTESGIPDFRGPNGVWTRDPEAEKRSTIQYYMANPDARKSAWKNRITGTTWQAEPNSGHSACAALHAMGKLGFLVTQNVDGLHQAGGFPPEAIVEIHGTVRDFMCMSCPDRGPIERVLDRVRAGDEDPHCRSCGGILKSATISFGQGLVAADLYRSQAEAERADLFLAIGTSLGVYPAAELPLIALRNGAPLIILNAEPTPFDEYAAAILREPLGRVLPALVERLSLPETGHAEA